MTDEEIEKALKEMTLTLNWGTVERIGAVSTDGSGDNKHGGVPKDIAVIQAALDYINRLKAENVKLKETLNAIENDEINLRGNLEECLGQLKQIRKDTAKEILRDMQLRLLHDYTNEEMGYQYPNIATADIYQDLKEIAEKYGVEMDDE